MPTVKQQTMRRSVVPAANGAVQSLWDIPRSLKMLVYGESGSGKTCLWSTFPRPILALICSGRKQPGEMLSLEDTPENRKTIVPLVLDSYEQAQEQVAAAGGKYGTVVLDHGSGLQDLIIKEHLGLDDVPVAKFKKAGKGEAWGLVPQSDWGDINGATIKILRTLLNLPCNVVIVTQEKVFKGKEDIGSTDVIKPSIGGAMTPQVMAWLNPTVDYVVQMFKRPKMVQNTVSVNGVEINTTERGKGVEYCLRTEPHDIYITKFRIPKGRTLPDVIVDPSYDKILALINGKTK